MLINVDHYSSNFKFSSSPVFNRYSLFDSILWKKHFIAQTKLANFFGIIISVQHVFDHIFALFSVGPTSGCDTKPGAGMGSILSQDTIEFRHSSVIPFLCVRIISSNYFPWRSEAQERSEPRTVRKERANGSSESEPRPSKQGLTYRLTSKEVLAKRYLAKSDDVSQHWESFSSEVGRGDGMTVFYVLVFILAFGQLGLSQTR